MTRIHVSVQRRELGVQTLYVVRTEPKEGDQDREFVDILMKGPPEWRDTDFEGSS